MVSIKVLAIFFSLCVLATKSEAKSGCCMKYTTGRLPFAVIRGYSVQTVTEKCPIDAIIFHTQKGKACTNPTLNWVMQYINRLRTKAMRVHMNAAQPPQ